MRTCCSSLGSWHSLSLTLSKNNLLVRYIRIRGPKVGGLPSFFTSVLTLTFVLLLFWFFTLLSVERIFRFYLISITSLRTFNSHLLEDIQSFVVPVFTSSYLFKTVRSDLRPLEYLNRISFPPHTYIMGQAFSGPNAFNFFGFTPKATAVLRADPFLLIALLLVIVGMISLGLIAFWIHFVTNKVS